MAPPIFFPKKPKALSLLMVCLLLLTYYC